MKHRIKLILNCVRQYKVYAILTPIFMVIEAFLECLLPFMMSLLIDSFEGLTNAESIFTPQTLSRSSINLPPMSTFAIIITLVVMALLSLASGLFGGVTAAKASVGLATNLRNELYQKIQTFSFTNMDKFSASSLITRLTTDVSQVQMSFQMCLRIVIRAPLMMIFSTVMAFLNGGVMAFIFVLLLPIVGFGLYLIVKKAMGIFRKLFKRYDAINQSIQENISAIRVVKSFVREDYEKQKFNKATDDIMYDFIKAEKIVALNNPLLNTAVHLSNILVVGLGTYFICKSAHLGTDGTIIYGQLSIGQMSSLLTYGIQILMSLQIMSMIMVFLVMSVEAVNRIGEVFEEESTIQNPENPIYELTDGSVKFDKVYFKYAETAEKNTLDNINVDIKSGQFVGVLGSTGTGKTTFINLICRLYDINEGSLTVGGNPVDQYDLKTLRDSVAVVLQKNVLFSGTIRENLQWGDKNATDEELWNALEIAQAKEFVESFKDGLDTHIEQGGANVSGGQKQRLCIARAILKKPKILILDDSTSAVDTKTDRLIRKGLKEDIPSTTKIVIAQRISSIEDADQIIIMNHGMIDQIGTHDELLKTNKIYQEVYYTQNKVGGNK